jgi:hypothetical protein
MDDVAHLGKRIAELTAQIEQLAAAPSADRDGLAALLKELEKAEHDRRRALRSAVESATPLKREGQVPQRQLASRGAIPVRERVLAGLELLGVPSRASLVSSAAVARTGLDVEPRQLASLRRSELASWRAAPDRRPSYVVPALHSRRFEPLRGVIASSAWEPWRRIVGPLSHRADHVRATARLAENIEWARAQSPDLAARYEQFLWRLARSVPSAGRETSLLVDKVLAAAKAELAMLDAEDRAEREAAADRLAKLPMEQQLFGAGLRVVREKDG